MKQRESRQEYPSDADRHHAGLAHRSAADRDQPVHHDAEQRDQEVVQTPVTRVVVFGRVRVEISVDVGTPIREPYLARVTVVVDDAGLFELRDVGLIQGDVQPLLLFVGQRLRLRLVLPLGTIRQHIELWMTEQRFLENSRR